jgi:thiamine biosynthesis protein ThiI
VPETLASNGVVMGSAVKKASRLSVVARVHEIALKGYNRPWFMHTLVRNIEHALRGVPHERPRVRNTRVVIAIAGLEAWPAVRERLAWVFGIANFSLALETGLGLDQLQHGLGWLLELLGPPAGRYRVRVKRTNKGYPLTSQELERVLGQYIKDRTGAPVDLTAPDVTYHIEILYDRALVSGEAVKGPGGLPVGVSGRVVVLLSGGFDSPVAAYRMMKRGCLVTLVHCHAYPYVRPVSLEKVVEIAQHLGRYQPGVRLSIVPIGDAQREIALASEPGLRVVLYRRLMLRIATAIAHEQGAGAIVTGESLGQVSSQTLENMRVIGAVTDLPLLRPLVGCNKDEIVQEAERIGTAPISRVPDDDCCTVFIPHHPVTSATLGQAAEAEQAFDPTALLDSCLARRTDYDGDPARWDVTLALAAAAR